MRKLKRFLAAFLAFILLVSAVPIHPVMAGPTNECVQDNNDGTDIDLKSIKQPITPEPTKEPVTPEPTKEPVTPEPTKEPVTPEPTKEPVTPEPTKEPVTPEPTKEPVTPEPTKEPVTPEPTKEPVTPEPTKQPVIYGNSTMGKTDNTDQFTFNIHGDGEIDLYLAEENVTIKAKEGTTVVNVPKGTYISLIAQSHKNYINIDIKSNEGIPLGDSSFYKANGFTRDFTASGIDKYFEINFTNYLNHNGFFKMFSLKSYPDENRPVVNDVFTGSAEVTNVDIHPDSRVLGVEVKILDGILSELGTIRVNCADKGAAAPFVGQKFTYTFTIRIVMTTGEVTGYFYAHANEDSATDETMQKPHGKGYQRLEGNFTITRKYPIPLWIKKQDATEKDPKTGDYWMLPGAKFNLWGWDGTGYTRFIGTFKDTNDGWYVMENVTRDMAVNGYFLVQEADPPSGYSNKYYTYNSKDQMDRDNPEFKGRQFQLDENNVWHCTTLKDSGYSYPEKGFTFSDYQYTKLRVFKQDATTINPQTGDYWNLPGAIFLLWGWDGTGYNRKIGTFRDNGDGTYDFPNITRDMAVDGYFLVEEANPPSGYSNKYYTYNQKDQMDRDNPELKGRQFQLDENYDWSCYTLKDFSWPDGGFIFYDFSKTKLTITKVDSDHPEKKLPGAEFELWGWSEIDQRYSKKIKDFTDNGDGTYSVEFYLNDADKTSNSNYWYVIWEKKAPEGYQIDTGEMGSQGKEIYYDSQGHFMSDPSTLTIKNTKGEKNLSLRKKSSKPTLTDTLPCYSLEGAEYGVYTEEECKNIVGKLVTDKNGVSDVLKLKKGTYYVKELKAPYGFCLDKKVHKVLLAEKDVELQLTDKPYVDPIAVLIKKVDADTGKPIPVESGTLEGAEFTFKYYATEDSLSDPADRGERPVRSWVFRTNKNGFIRLGEDWLVSGDELYYSDDGNPTLPVGVVTIKETKAPEGYHMDPTLHIVPIRPLESPGATTSYVTPIIKERSIKLHLVKTQAGTDIPVPGAVFEHIRPDKTTKLFTTDKDGKILIQGLEYGDHIIKEKNSPEGYLLTKEEIRFKVKEDGTIKILSNTQDITLNVTASGDISAAVKEELKPYRVTVIKEDDSSKKLFGAEFTLYKDPDCQTELDKQISDQNGLVIFENLIPGIKYYLKETKAPAGYRLPEDNQAVEISTEFIPANGIYNYFVNGKEYHGTDNDSSQPVYITGTDIKDIHLQIINLPDEKKLSLIKKSADPDLIKDHPLYALEGAEYTVFKEKHCITKVGTLITDSNGQSNTLILPCGTYYIKETKAPKGYLMDKKIYTVLLANEDQVLEVEDIPWHQIIDVMVNKIDADTQQPSSVLQGAEFELKYYPTNEKEPSVLENKIPERTWILRTDKNGIIKLSEDYMVKGDPLYTYKGEPCLLEGVITIKETKAPEGYHINDELFIVPLSYDEKMEVETLYHAPVVQERPIKMKIVKYQAGTDIPIPGVIFEHINPDQTSELLTTDDRGEITVCGLKTGNHILKEKSSPDGYFINENQIRFIVNENGTIKIMSNPLETEQDGKIILKLDNGDIDITVENKLKPYKLQIFKENEKKVKLSGAEFTLYKDPDCQTELDKQISDQNGVVLFENLIPGIKYYLKETKAPAGYRLPEDNKAVEISTEFVPINGIYNYYFNGIPLEEIDNNNIQISSENGQSQLQIHWQNHTGILLPETGSAATIIMIGLGMIMMITALLMNKKRRER